MFNQVPDDKQRQQALDITQSFIVQAPAGSGKTELLTQRYLKLLTRVQSPEEIIAITFTNKAVAEMQERIILALQKAANEPEPAASHAKQTWHLACAVLQHDKQQQWQLLSNPSRLRILTIDALCLRLASQLPIQSKLGTELVISDDPEFLYLNAAIILLKQLDQDDQISEYIATLLLHCDNDLNRIAQLLTAMLAKRDQWLAHTIHNKTENQLRSELENELVYSNELLIKDIVTAFPSHLADQLDELAQFAASQLPEGSSSYIANCAECIDLHNTSVDRKNYWMGVAELLLTATGTWRKQVTKKIGFPAPSSTKNKEDKAKFNYYKTSMAALLEQCGQLDELNQSLITFKMAPAVEYTNDQWQVLHALLHLLPLAAATLKVIFAKHNCIDYVENSLAALLALGNEEQPTDLSLVLDYKIQHILTDEFQDTSVNQFRLLQQLTAGWEPHDGRTMFIVGDPMQSIYRFRQAEVGLFLHARQRGIGHISLTSLHLQSNFRSQQKIVDWNNQCFSDVFPQKDDIRLGAVSYSPSHAIHQNTDDSTICFHSANNEQTQAAIIAKSIKNQSSNDRIAILVQSRNQLIEIIPQLQAHNIPYQAVDIEKLHHRPVIQDLVSLTKAMLHLGDRIAWLALLRAPWCGISLLDCFAIANAPETCIYEAIQSPSIIDSLSDDGQRRVQSLSKALTENMQQRERLLLRDWIQQTWQQLQGDCYIDDNDRDNVIAYFELLDTISKSVNTNIYATIEQKVQRLFAKPQRLEDNPVQLMTIHKSKGLEFDIVYLPGLHKRSASNSKQLLNWLEYPDEQNIHHVLLAPISQLNQHESIYNYIAFKESQKHAFEKARLLYVATTRAKKQLHLCACLEYDDEGNVKNPGKQTLLALLWPGYQQQFIEAYQQGHPLQRDQLGHPKLSRLPLSVIACSPVAYTYSTTGDNVPHLDLKLDISSKLGTVIHFIIQQITEQGLEYWHKRHKDYLTALLQAHRILPSYMSYCLTQIDSCIESMLKDKVGQRLLQRHQDDCCEYAISTPAGDVILDRIFVDESGVRWIIDYKTSDPLDEASLSQYREQLEKYSKAMRALDSRPIKCALYYPMQATFIEIEQPTKAK